MIKGTIVGQRLTITMDKAVADSIDYLTASFRFVGWDDMTAKVAHFRKGDTVYDIVLTNDEIRESDHLNLSAGTWEIYIHGNGNGQRITTDVQEFRVYKTGVLDGQPMPEIPETVAEQILEKASNAEQIAQEIKRRADSHEFDGADGYSPVASAKQIENGTVITITDKTGTTTVIVHDGKPGAPGVGIASVRYNADSTVTFVLSDGTEYSTSSLRGYTPVKGVDYFDGYTPVKGKDYFDGAPGAPGISVTGSHISADNHLILELSNGTEVDAGEIKSGGIKSVSAGGTALTIDAAGNVDIPRAGKGIDGLTRVNSTYGVYLKSDGSLAVGTAGSSEINGRTNSYKPITPSCLVYAFNSVLCSTAATEQLTDDQKAAAQQRLGIETLTQAEYDSLTTIGENTLYFIVEE